MSTLNFRPGPSRKKIKRKRWTIDPRKVAITNENHTAAVYRLTLYNTFGEYVDRWYARTSLTAQVKGCAELKHFTRVNRHAERNPDLHNDTYEGPRPRCVVEKWSIKPNKPDPYWSQYRTYHGLARGYVITRKDKRDRFNPDYAIKYDTQKIIDRLRVNRWGEYSFRSMHR